MDLHEARQKSTIVTICERRKDNWNIEPITGGVADDAVSDENNEGNTVGIREDVESGITLSSFSHNNNNLSNSSNSVTTSPLRRENHHNSSNSVPVAPQPLRLIQALSPPPGTNKNCTDSTQNSACTVTANTSIDPSSLNIKKEQKPKAY